MLVTHTFLDKSNTIIEGSTANTGLNPIISLYYGNVHTRALIHFDTDKLKTLIEDKTYPDTSKLKHVLKFWNVSDINLPKMNCSFPDQNRTNDRERATSFELILFRLPNEWDAGRGFDFTPEPDLEGRVSYSEYGSSWYFRNTVDRWETPGVYSIEELEAEYDNPNSEIIIGKQHFDFGNEQFEVDITDTVNKFIDGTYENYGLGIAFAPKYEIIRDEVSQYAGFFGNRTNTFFEPYLETTYNDSIKDDRGNFFLDKPNRLYFYANVGGNSVNLDELPTCEVKGSQMAVKQATKGVYYIDIILSSNAVQPNTMIYDTWGNIKYNGISYSDITLSATTKSPEGYLSFGLPFETEKQPKFKPSLYGINNSETIKRGDIRKVTVECKINYTTNQIVPTNSIQYRLYVKTADRQIDVIDWTECDTIFNSSCFYINTNELLPQTYYVDLKVKYDKEEIIERNLLSFNIANDGRKPE